MATDADCSPPQGTLIAGRYRLQDPLDRRAADAADEQHWRGFDEVLARSVMVTVLDAVGPDASDLLNSAVANGRVAHPGIASVFDAAAVDGCTYVVSEWVEGRPLSQLLGEGPLGSARSAAVLRAASEAVATLHGQGLVHGNLHPDNVVMTTDGGVKLTDLRTNADTDSTADVRCLGALLYVCLTGKWPSRLVGGAIAGVPDAPVDDDRLCEPRQVRAGVPGELSSLAMRALQPERSGLDAPRLVDELSGHAVKSHTGPLPVVEEVVEDRPRSAWRRSGIPIGILGLIAVAGLLVGMSLGAIPAPKGYPAFDSPRQKASPSPAAVTTPLSVTGASILDPNPLSDHTEGRGADLSHDGNPATSWRTDDYKNAKFGGLKPAGMGVLLDLGAVRRVRQVTVDVAESGATGVELMYGDSSGETFESYRLAGTQDASGNTVMFHLSAPISARYWVVRFSTLPPHNGQYGVGVAEVHFS